MQNILGDIRYKKNPAYESARTDNYQQLDYEVNSPQYQALIDYIYDDSVDFTDSNIFQNRLQKAINLIEKLMNDEVWKTEELFNNRDLNIPLKLYFEGDVKQTYPPYLDDKYGENRIFGRYNIVKYLVEIDRDDTPKPDANAIVQHLFRARTISQKIDDDRLIGSEEGTMIGNIQYKLPMLFQNHYACCIGPCAKLYYQLYRWGGCPKAAMITTLIDCLYRFHGTSNENVPFKTISITIKGNPITLNGVQALSLASTIGKMIWMISLINGVIFIKDSIYGLINNDNDWINSTIYNNGFRIGGSFWDYNLGASSLLASSTNITSKILFPPIVHIEWADNLHIWIITKTILYPYGEYDASNTYWKTLSSKKFPTDITLAGEWNELTYPDIDPSRLIIGTKEQGVRKDSIQIIENIANLLFSDINADNLTAHAGIPIADTMAFWLWLSSALDIVRLHKNEINLDNANSLPIEIFQHFLGGDNLNILPYKNLVLHTTFGPDVGVAEVGDWHKKAFSMTKGLLPSELFHLECLKPLDSFIQQLRTTSNYEFVRNVMFWAMNTRLTEKQPLIYSTENLNSIDLFNPIYYEPLSVYQKTDITHLQWILTRFAILWGVDWLPGGNIDNLVNTIPPLDKFLLTTDSLILAEARWGSLLQVLQYLLASAINDFSSFIKGNSVSDIVFIPPLDFKIFVNQFGMISSHKEGLTTVLNLLGQPDSWPSKLDDKNKFVSQLYDNKSPHIITVYIDLAGDIKKTEVQYQVYDQNNNAMYDSLQKTNVGYYSSTSTADLKINLPNATSTSIPSYLICSFDPWLPDNFAGTITDPILPEAEEPKITPSKSPGMPLKQSNAVAKIISNSDSIDTFVPSKRIMDLDTPNPKKVKSSSSKNDSINFTSISISISDEIEDEKEIEMKAVLISEDNDKTYTTKTDWNDDKKIDIIDEDYTPEQLLKPRWISYLGIGFTIHPPSTKLKVSPPMFTLTTRKERQIIHSFYVEGASGLVSFSIKDGTLPPGISLSVGGSFKGTIKKDAMETTYTANILIQDAKKDNVIIPVSITILPELPTIKIIDQNLPDLILNKPYETEIKYEVSDKSNYPINWEMGTASLPHLSIDNTGKISGTESFGFHGAVVYFQVKAELQLPLNMLLSGDVLPSSSNIFKITTFGNLPKIDFYFDPPLMDNAHLNDEGNNIDYTDDQKSKTYELHVTADGDEVQNYDVYITPEVPPGIIIKHSSGELKGADIVSRNIIAESHSFEITVDVNILKKQTIQKDYQVNIKSSITEKLSKHIQIIVPQDTYEFGVNEEFSIPIEVDINYEKAEPNQYIITVDNLFELAVFDKENMIIKGKITAVGNYLGFVITVKLNPEVYPDFVAGTPEVYKTIHVHIINKRTPEPPVDPTPTPTPDVDKSQIVLEYENKLYNPGDTITVEVFFDRLAQIKMINSLNQDSKNTYGFLKEGTILLPEYKDTSDAIIKATLNIPGIELEYAEKVFSLWGYVENIVYKQVRGRIFTLDTFKELPKVYDLIIKQNGNDIIFHLKLTPSSTPVAPENEPVKPVITNSSYIKLLGADYISTNILESNNENTRFEIIIWINKNGTLVQKKEFFSGKYYIDDFVIAAAVRQLVSYLTFPTLTLKTSISDGSNYIWESNKETSITSSQNWNIFVLFTDPNYPIQNLINTFVIQNKIDGYQGTKADRIRSSKLLDTPFSANFKFKVNTFDVESATGWVERIQQLYYGGTSKNSLRSFQLNCFGISNMREKNIFWESPAISVKTVVGGSISLPAVSSSDIILSANKDINMIFFETPPVPTAECHVYNIKGKYPMAMIGSTNNGNWVRLNETKNAGDSINYNGKLNENEYFVLFGLILNNEYPAFLNNVTDEDASINGKNEITTIPIIKKPKQIQLLLDIQPKPFENITEPVFEFGYTPIVLLLAAAVGLGLILRIKG